MDGHGDKLTLVLVFLTVCSNTWVSGGSPGRPDKLTVSLLDGEATVAWVRPVNVTSPAQYSVQMSIYNMPWVNVSHCTMMQATHCDLSGLIDNYRALHRVRVHTVTANGVSEWAVIKKFLPTESKLRPPTFTLSATSSSLTVTVDEKPVLKKLFPYGITYTIYLNQRGKDNETTKASLNDNSEEAMGRTQTFRSLHWGREYCVQIQVEGIGERDINDISAQKCLLLPKQEWYTITVASLSTLVVLAMLTMLLCVLCCFVRLPEKTPVALKSPKTGWSPLVVGEGNMEVVTDKGWLLSMGWVNKVPGTLHAVVQETEWKNERRTSMDSGVSVGSNGTAKMGGSDPAKLEDSGCAIFEGSQGAESFGSAAVEEHHTQGRCVTPVSAEGKTEDSGDSGDSGLVDVVVGYRKGQLSCMPQMNQGSWPGHAELPEEEITFSTNYRRKTHIQMETVVSVDDSESPSNWLHAAFEEESAPLFLPLMFPPLETGDLGCAMNTVPISICDVELWSE